MDSLMQCSGVFSVWALEIPQSCTKPSMQIVEYKRDEASSLNTDSCHNTNFGITASAEVCHNDNLQSLS